MFTELKIYHEKKNHASPCLRRKISGKAFGSKNKIMQKKIAQPSPPPSNIQWSVPNMSIESLSNDNGNVNENVEKQ